MKANSLAILICSAALAVGLGELTFRYDQLPENVASHFNAQGQPNGWTSKAQYVVSMVCLLIGLPGLLLFCFASIHWMPTSAINMPNKEYWLSDENREQTCKTVVNLGWWMTAATLLFLVALNHQVLAANLKPQGQLTSMWWLMGVYLVVVAFWTVEFYRWFRGPAAKTA